MLDLILFAAFDFVCLDDPAEQIALDGKGKGLERERFLPPGLITRILRSKSCSCTAEGRIQPPCTRVFCRGGFLCAAQKGWQKNQVLNPWLWLTNLSLVLKIRIWESAARPCCGDAQLPENTAKRIQHPKKGHTCRNSPFLWQHSEHGGDEIKQRQTCP